MLRTQFPSHWIFLFSLLFFGGWGAVSCGMRDLSSWTRDQGSNPRPLQWKHGVLTTELPGNSQHWIFQDAPRDLWPLGSWLISSGVVGINHCSQRFQLFMGKLMYIVLHQWIVWFQLFCLYSIYCSQLQWLGHFQHLTLRILGNLNRVLK